MGESPPDPSAVRLCLSSSPACAGLSPCEACRTALAQYVIPGGLAQAGIQDGEAVVAFVDGYNAARKLLLQEIARAMEARKRQPTEPLDRPTSPSASESVLAPTAQPSGPIPGSVEEALADLNHPKPSARALRSASRKPTLARTPKKTPAAAPAAASPLPANGAAGEAHPAPDTRTSTESVEETKT